MVRKILSDAEIVARYTGGEGMATIPAGKERIERVLATAGVPKRKPGGTPPATARRNAAMVADYEAGVAAGRPLEDVLAGIAERYAVSEKWAVEICRYRRHLGPRPHPNKDRWIPEVRACFDGPELADPARADTALRRRLIERANARKLEEYQRA